MHHSKKGVINLTSYSLILILLFATFIFTYNYYKDTREEIEDQTKRSELLFAATSFRTELLGTVSHNGSTLNYSSELDPQGILLELEEQTIRASQPGSSVILQVNVTTFGVPFCSVYNFTSASGAQFSFNGSCFSLITP